MVKEVLLSIGLAAAVCIGTLWILDTGIIQSLSASEHKTSKTSKPGKKSWIEWIFGDRKKNDRNSYGPFDSAWEPDEFEYEVPEIDYGYDDDEYYFE